MNRIKAIKAQAAREEKLINPQRKSSSTTSQATSSSRTPKAKYQTSPYFEAWKSPHRKVSVPLTALKEQASESDKDSKD